MFKGQPKGLYALARRTRAGRHAADVEEVSAREEASRPAGQAPGAGHQAPELRGLDDRGAGGVPRGAAGADEGGQLALQGSTATTGRSKRKGGGPKNAEDRPARGERRLSCAE